MFSCQQKDKKDTGLGCNAEEDGFVADDKMEAGSDAENANEAYHYDSGGGGGAFGSVTKGEDSGEVEAGTGTNVKSE